MNEITLNNLNEVDEIRFILSLEKRAKEYLKKFNWCLGIKKSWYDSELCIYDLLGIFLFEIEPINSEIDNYIWVIVGDLPSVYLDESANSAVEALDIYCELMESWANNIIEGKSVEDCYPIPNEPTNENAELLKSRIEFIRSEILQTE